MVINQQKIKISKKLSKSLSKEFQQKVLKIRQRFVKLINIKEKFILSRFTSYKQILIKVKKPKSSKTKVQLLLHKHNKIMSYTCTNLSDNEKQLKKFLQIVGMAPNVQNVVFLLYNNKNSQPQRLFGCYQPEINYKSLQEDLFCAVTQINGKKTAIFGLNQSFLNLKDDKEILTSKHLILLYLLRKYHSVKFCFCFDKDTISDSSFRSVNQLFERFAFLINYDKIKHCSESFMILLYQSSNQTIIETAKINLKKSIMEKDFYKENPKLVQNIQKSTVNQNMFIQINRNSSPQELENKKKQFQRMISKLHPIKFSHDEKVMPISNSFLRILQQKSSNWQVFKKKQNLSKSQLTKTQSTTKSKKQNSQIHLLFSIWQDIFQQTIKYVVKKLKKPKHNFNQLSNSSKFLPENVCEKYTMPKTGLFDSMESKKISSSDIYKLFLKVVTLIIKIIKDKRKANEGKVLSWNNNLISFIQLFYQCKVFDQNKNQKTLFDSFMIFNQLFEVFYPIRDIHDKQLPFFSEIKMMLDHVNQEPIIKNNFLQNLSQIFIFQLQVDLNSVKKGQPIVLERLSMPLKKIKQIANQKQFEQILSKQRILSTIQQFQQLLFEQKLNKLSKNYQNKIFFILDSLRNQQDLFDKKDIFIQLVKTILNYLEENKLKDVRLQFKAILIDILSIDPNEIKLTIKAYQREFQNLIKTNPNLHQNLSYLEQKFVETYIKYLLKAGYVQKAQQKAQMISQIDDNLSKRLMLECLLKTNSKRHFQFIKNSISIQKKNKLNAKFDQALKLIQNQFTKINSNVEKDNKKIDQVLLDI